MTTNLSEVVQRYVACLDGPDGEDACHSLEHLGAEALPLVIEAFRTSHQFGTRLQLLRVVSEYRSTEAIPFLAELLRDGHDEIPPQDWLIDGVLPKGGSAVLFGDSGTGKTFTALDWSFHIGLGRQWLGRGVKKGPVVYIAGEGGSGYWCGTILAAT